MALKSLYLGEGPNHKALSRELLIAGEDQIAAGVISGMPFLTQTLIAGFSAEEARSRKQRNYRVIAERLSTLPGIRLIEPLSMEVVPFCVLLMLPTGDRRDRLRIKLINSNVYPAILWSLENPVVQGIRPSDIALSRRLLMIPCDGRYSTNHMLSVGEIIATELALI
jgi:dTDP-4-amino-4,6-dideoxygalactose transaminase